jgi:hypothetical protein
MIETKKNKKKFHLTNTRAKETNASPWGSGNLIVSFEFDINSRTWKMVPWILRQKENLKYHTSSPNWNIKAVSESPVV